MTRTTTESRTRAAGAAMLWMVCAATATLAADAQLVSLGVGSAVQGTIGGTPRNLGFAGVFNISIDGGPTTQGYCVDLNHTIRIGDTVAQIPPDYPCEVVYILNTFYPQATPVLTAAKEAAAVQAAIWFFTDGYVITGPADITARANDIIAAAQPQCTAVPPVPHTVTVTPASASSFLPGPTTHTVTATLRDTNDALIPNHAIRIEVTGVSGPKVIDGTTDGAGQFTAQYTNDFAVTGTDTITASASFTVPVGLEFKTGDKQGIVLAGTPRTGTVDGTATKDWVSASCGDGVINLEGEECDDGNTVDGDGCDANCTTTRCGNNVHTAGEECDDGNQSSGDGCDANCRVTGCGSGVVSSGEECDDGNQTDGDGCDSNCKTTRCGNGVVTAGEECDDSNVTSGDGCDANCTTTRCGNGLVAGTEECDDANPTDGDGCDNNCTTTRCGNGHRTAGEQCDDGNVASGDGCDANCTNTGCGNGIVTAGEQCDDGNGTNGDGCNNNCTVPGCGNGVLEGGEQCDDGNGTNGDGCDNNCRPTGCGNGVVSPGEQCDDGNGASGDGCDANCRPTGCGNGAVTAGEQCDDGNGTSGDGCDTNCTPTACGNGIRTSPEECDDGNTADADGCEGDCTDPFCGNGIIDPGEGCDDGNTADGDGCSAECRALESCTDLYDNDVDGLIDAEDPDCLGVCKPILRDPGLIAFDPTEPKDRMRGSGGIPLTSSAVINPATERVGILLTNQDDVLLRHFIEPGNFTVIGKKWFFRDKTALVSGGLFRMEVGRIGNAKERHRIKYKAFGDFDAATVATMTFEIVIGDDCFYNKATWRRISAGWKLGIRSQ